jgi:hypothetical protein
VVIVADRPQKSARDLARNTGTLRERGTRCTLGDVQTDVASI